MIIQSFKAYLKFLWGLKHRGVTPNGITTWRTILLIFPIELWFLGRQEGLIVLQWIAFACAVGIWPWDRVDGDLARKTAQKTAWGKIFDQLSDKIKILAMILLFIFGLPEPVVYMTIAMIVLDIISALLKTTQNSEKTNPFNAGKFKLGFQVIWLGCYALAELLAMPIFNTIGHVCLGIALALATYSVGKRIRMVVADFLARRRVQPT